MKLFSGLSVSLCLLTSASLVQAMTTLGAASISSPQGDAGGNFSLVNIINQSGLSATYTNGVTDFNTFTATTTNAGDNTDSGFTGTATASTDPQQFTFDLGSLQIIDALAIWNVNDAGGVILFEVYADTDADFSNGTSGLLLGATTLLKDPSPAQVFSFASTLTQFVHINGLETDFSPRDLHFGLGEVVFRAGAATSTVPEPITATLGLMGLGLLGLAMRRRRVAGAERSVPQSVDPAILTGNAGVC